MHFWSKLKLMTTAPEVPNYRHIQVIVFAAYGDRPSSGTLVATPFTFPAAYGAHLLFCTKSEAHELVEEFNRKNEAKIMISQKMEEHLNIMTEGHIGLLSRTLVAIEEHFKDFAKRFGQITDEKLAAYLLSAAYNNTISVFRAAPQLDSLPVVERKILEQVLLNDVIRTPEDPESRGAVFNLMKKGILRYEDKTRDQKFTTSTATVCFISPLVRILAFRFCCSSPRSIADIPTLETFVVKCLERMKPSYFKKCLGKGLDKLLLERSWQMEFYRIATSLLPQDCFISADVGHCYGATGDADFYVNDKKQWIIELIREGDRLGEHHARFEPEGLYALIPRKDSVLLDFRTHTKGVRQAKSGVWYVKYDEEFTEATIVRQGCADFKVQFLGDLLSSQGDPKVKQWLTEKNLLQWLDKFIEAQVDWETLPNLTKEDLKDMGIPVGPCRKILTLLSTIPQTP